MMVWDVSIFTARGTLFFSICFPYSVNLSLGSLFIGLISKLNSFSSPSDVGKQSCYQTIASTGLSTTHHTVVVPYSNFRNLIVL